MTFSEAATTVIREDFIDIAKIIEKLTQPRDLKVSMIDAGGASMSTMDAVEESSLLGDFREELSSSTPQQGEDRRILFRNFCS